MIAQLDALHRARVRIDAPVARGWPALRDSGVAVRTRRAVAGPIDVVLDDGQGGELVVPAHATSTGDGVVQLRFDALADAIVAAHAEPGERDWFVLDPLCERVPDRKAGLTLLLSPVFERAIVVPDSDVLVELVDGLREPAAIADLLDEYDDRELITSIVTLLAGAGFGYRIADPGRVAPRMEVLRYVATGTLERPPRTTLELELGAMTRDDVIARLRGFTVAPSVALYCDELAAHRALFEQLARMRRDTLRLHDVQIVVGDGTCDRELGEILFALNARIRLATAAWSTAAVLAKHRLDVSATVDVSPGWTIDATRDAVAAHGLTGVALAFDAGAADRDALVALFDRGDALEDAIGHVEWLDLASPEQVLGNVAATGATIGTRATPARRIHLERVVRKLRSVENRTLWAQIPEAEALWVRPGEDLLPNNPSLLGLEPGMRVVDVCGGLGRVARRLAPLVGPTGSVVSVEMEGHVVERARRFAAEGGFGWVQFRQGLAQRLPLPDACADAVVNEWTGAIWQLGLGPAMLREMARVVRPGGRVAITHRIVLLELDEPTRSSASIPHIHRLVREAVAATELEIVTEKIWGQTLPSFCGAPKRWMAEQYLPRLVDSLTGTFEDKLPDRADVYLTLVAQRR